MSDSNTVAVPKNQAEFQAAATGLLDKLLRDPKTARQTEDLIRTVNPAASFPGRDLAESYVQPALTEAAAARAEAKEAKEALAADRAERAEQAQIAKLEARLEAARKKYGWADDTIAQQVLKRMQEQNSPDVDAAAAFVNESLPKPPPVNRATSDYLPSQVDLYGSQSKDEGYRKLHENPWGYFDGEVRSVLADPSLAA
jgi:hypothetical protein